MALPALAADTTGGVTRHLVTSDYVKPEMTPGERTAFFSAGAGLISPLEQIIRAFEADLSF